MKAVKISILILLILFIIPLSYAEITIQPLQQQKYNAGDQVLIQGEISQTENFRGRLDEILKCTTGELKINTLTVDTTPEKSQHYSTLFLIPQTVNGKCNIEFNLKDTSGNIKETKTFEILEVTNELNAIYDLKKTEYQAGEILTIKGIATKISGTPITGIATFIFSDSQGIAFIDSAQINSGTVEYTKELSFIPEGEYKLTIETIDGMGNKKTSADIYLIKISNELEPSISFNKNNYNPGDNVELFGIIKSSLGRALENLEVIIQFEDETKIELTLEKGTDSIKALYTLASNVKSGEHKIKITSRDNKGNYGEKEVIFSVTQVPTKLEIKSDKTNYNPEEDIVFTVNLKDQADDPITDSIIVGLIQGKDKVISTKTVKIDTQDTIKIPESSKPGEWILRTEGYGLYHEIPIKINEYTKIDAQISGTDLILTNKGNVDYKNNVLIKSDDKDYTKNMKIGIGDNKKIDLSKLLSEGTHSLSLPSIKDNLGKINIPKKEGIFNKLTGGAVTKISSSNSFMTGGILLLVILLGVSYLFINKGRKNRKFEESNKRKQDYEDGQKMLERLRNKGIRKNPISRQEYGKANQEDIADFKKRIHQTIKEEEQKMSRDDFLNQQRSNIKKDRPPSGMFNMFN